MLFLLCHIYSFIYSQNKYLLCTLYLPDILLNAISKIMVNITVMALIPIVYKLLWETDFTQANKQEL